MVTDMGLTYTLGWGYGLGTSDMDERPYEAEAASGDYCIDDDDDWRAR